MLAAATQLAGQQPTSAPAVRMLQHGDRLELEFGTEQVAEAKGGALAHFRLDIPDDALVVVWASSEVLDAKIVLTVETPGADTPVVVVDGSSGGGRDPCIEREAKAGEAWKIAVEAEDSDRPGGPVVVGVWISTWTDATRKTVAGIHSLAAAIDAEVAEGRFHEARRLAVEATSPDDRAPHVGIARALLKLGDAASHSHAMSSARVVWSETVAVFGRTLPPKHRSTHMAKSNLAITLRNLGDVQGAKELQEAVLVVHEATLPADHADLWSMRGSYAITLARLGDLNGARKLQEDVLEFCERTLPAGDSDLLRAKVNLAATLQQLGDLPRARELLVAVLPAYERTLPARDPTLHLVRAILAATLHALADLEGARVLQEAILEGCEATYPAGHEEILAAKANLGATLWGLGILPRAKELQEAVLEIRAATLPADDPELLKARANLAMTLRDFGELPRAREIQESVLALSEATLAAEHPWLLTARTNLAATLHDCGDLLRAKELQEAVVGVLEATNDSKSRVLLTARANLAVTLGTLGESIRAKELQEAVLESCEATLPAQSADVLAARSNLAATLFSFGDLERARELQESVLSVHEAGLPADNHEIQKARSNLAATLFDLGDVSRARELQEAVLDVFERTLPAGHFDIQRARANLAVTRRALGDLRGARKLQEAVLETLAATLVAGHPELQSARVNLAVTLSDLGDPRGAQRLLAQVAQEIGDAMRLSQERFDGAAAQGIVAASRGFLSSILSFGRASGDADATSRVARLAYEFALVETVRGIGPIQERLMARLAVDVGSAVDDLRAALRRTDESLTSAIRRGAEPMEVGTLNDARRTLGKDLRATIEKAAGARAMLPQWSQSRLSGQMAPDEALLSFVVYRHWEHDDREKPWVTTGTGDQLCVFVLRQDQGLHRIELGDLGTVERLVDAARREMMQASERSSAGVDGDRSDADQSALTTISACILGPLRAVLDGCSRLTISLDGPLHLLPFEALPHADGKVFGDVMRVSYVPALTELLLPPPPALVPRRFLAFGGIDYGAATATTSPTGHRGAGVRVFGVEGEDERVDPFPALEASGDEVEAIGELYLEAFGDTAESEVAILTGGHAARGALIKSVTAARWLHLATHGWFAEAGVRCLKDRPAIDPKKPWLSWSGDLNDSVRGYLPQALCGIALAGANLKPDRYGNIAGRMTALEMRSLNLSGCDLVTLSACDTNVGLVRASQGIESLATTLIGCGARSVLCSLWKVPDGSTAVFMGEFYKRLWIEKLGKADALRATKAWMRAQKTKNGGDTYGMRDWAGWRLIGED